MSEQAARATSDDRGTLKRSGGRSALGFLVDLARFGWKQLLRNQAPEMAAALAYRTIFSLVPVLVLSLVIFKAFLGEAGMKQALSDLMAYTGIDQIQFTNGGAEPATGGAVETPAAGEPAMPEGTAAPTQQNGEAPADTTRLADTLQDFVNKTVSRIQGINFGLITVVGVIVLVYGALSLVIQVELAFNTICRAPSGRRLRARLTSYFTLLTAGPFLLLGGFVLSAYSVKWLANLTPWAATPLNLLSRFGITWILFLIAYCWMPNARIRTGAAAVGALLAAVAWEFAKSLLTAFVAYLASPETGGQTAVYGSLALLPIFLMWVYITWLIVLFGFEVTYACQTVATGRHVALSRADDVPIVDPAVGVILMRAGAERFETGKTFTADEMASRAGLTEVAAERVLAHLVKKGFLHRVESAKDADEHEYVLARPPEAISAADVLGAMHDLSGEVSVNGSADSDSGVIRMLRQSQLEALRTLNLGTLRADRPAAGSSAPSS